MSRLRIALCVWLSLVSINVPIFAQSESGDASSVWDDFIEECVVPLVGFESEATEENADAAALRALIDHYDELRHAPLNLNTVSRAELLELPFLDEALADSLLAYRERKGGFVGLGELMLVSGFDFTLRRYLSLFLTCSPVAPAPASLRERLAKGRFEVQARLDVPLYRRAGYADRTATDLAEHPSAYYLGQPLHYLTRLRYDHHRNLRYGVTLEQDAGEPLWRKGSVPADYVSAYVAGKMADGRGEWVVGDFDLSLGCGLTAGFAAFGGQVGADHWLRPAARRNYFRPHTSADEVHFFRGVAAERSFGRWKLLGFASLRQLDGTLSGDTVRTLPATGLHRTTSELLARRTVSNLSAGARLQAGGAHWQAALGGYVSTFSRTVWPALRYYNRHYFRGRTAANLSADWRMDGRNWSCEGELAFDRHLHPAATVSGTLRTRGNWLLRLSARSFSSRYVSLYAEAPCQNSRVQNEHGLLLGASGALAPGLRLTATADAFLFPAPTYRNRHATKGLQTFVQLAFGRQRSEWKGQIAYRFRTRQQSVAGYDAVQYVGTHRISLQARYESRHWQFVPTLAASLCTQQVKKASRGIMLALRSRFAPSPRLSVAASAAFFATDDYSSALYVYEPQLPRAASIPACFGRGVRYGAVAVWNALPRLQLALRFAGVAYADRKSIGSGAQRIDAPTQNDVQAQLLWTF